MKLFRLVQLLSVCLFTATEITAANSSDPFSAGVAAYQQNDFPLAAKLFAESATTEPAAGTFQNLGNAEWRSGNTAEALVAWERALRLHPFDVHSENNLRFVRENAQLEAPELTWCEIASTWLPAETWAWLASGSLWFAVATMMLPGILRRRRSATQQALVAVGLGIFLLSLPANYGVWTRSQIGLVMKRETPLRLTPTAEGEAVTKLAAGEPGRVLRERGNHLLIRTRRTTGWVERDSFTLVAPR